MLYQREGSHERGFSKAVLIIFIGIMAVVFLF